MSQKIKFLFIFMFLMGILCLNPCFPQEEMPDLSRVKIISTHVAGNIYMLEATEDVAGNIAVSVGPDGILMVDTQFAPLGKLILAALRKICPGKTDIKYVINTHYHQDHTHGNLFFGKSALIIAHENAKRRLLDLPRSAQPTITFNQQLSLFFNGEEIKIIHYPPGHTDSDVVVFFTKSNVVHLGDLFNSGNWSFPTVDLEGGGSVMGMLRNIEDLIQLIPEGAKIIPGHYELSDLEGLKATRDMLVETISLVKRKKAAGLSLEQIKKEGLPPKYKDWGRGYTNAETWIENIYMGLEKESSLDKKLNNKY